MRMNTIDNLRELQNKTSANNFYFIVAQEQS